MEIENAWLRPAVCYLIEVRGMSMKEVADMFGVYHKFDTDVYREDILEPVDEWTLNHYGTDTEGSWNDWTFQQDSAPSHASVNENKEKFKVPTQTRLNDHFPDLSKKMNGLFHLRI